MKIIKEGDKFIIDFEGLDVDCSDMFGSDIIIGDLFNLEHVSLIINGNFDFNAPASGITMQDSTK